MSLKKQIQSEKVKAMKSNEKFTRNTLTLILSKIKQYEVDERSDLTNEDTIVLSLITKMIKERKDSIKMFKEADRVDLIQKETNEITIIEQFLPQQLSEDEISNIIDKVFETINPQSLKDMGKVMGILKPKIQGKVDMGSVSSLVKNILN